MTHATCARAKCLVEHLTTLTYVIGTVVNCCAISASIRTKKSARIGQFDAPIVTVKKQYQSYRFNITCTTHVLIESYNVRTTSAMFECLPARFQSTPTFALKHVSIADIATFHATERTWTDMKAVAKEDRGFNAHIAQTGITKVNTIPMAVPSAGSRVQTKNALTMSS